MNFAQLRIAFMGTPEFAAQILKKLLEAQVPIVAVYSQPPRPVGRGYKVMHSPVQALATEENIPIYTPVTLRTKEAEEEWKNLNLDLAIVAAYGLILPLPILTAPPLGCINVHGSLLPRWRGASPIQRAVLAGDKEIGVTIMKMDKGMDTGDMLLMKKIALKKDATTVQLFPQIAQLGAEALLEALPLYATHKLQPVPQPTEGVTYADKLTKSEGSLDWNLPASILERKVRALNPWPGTWLSIGENKLKVLKAEVLPENFGKPPGAILDNRLTIACKEGAFRPLLIQKAGKSPISIDEFLRGYKHPIDNLTHETV